VLGTVRGGFLALTVVVSLVASVFTTHPIGKPHAQKPHVHVAPKTITILWFGNSFPKPHTKVYHPTLPVHHRAIPKPRIEPVSAPMYLLPPSSRAGFTCIMWHESRSTPTVFHPTDYNAEQGAGGIFQFIPYIWQYGAKALGISATYAQEASVTDQFRVASFYYKRNGGFHPEWDGDYSCY